MYCINKQISDFSAAHRLTKGYQGKCRNLHGHDYAVEVTMATSTLNEYGFVIDFSEIKNLLDHWVQNHLDHVTIVSEDDEKLLLFLKENSQKFYVLPDNVNTTVENISKHLFDIFNHLLTKHNGVSLLTVSVSETKTAKAIYSERKL
jgi:6-pyruvoyltetrahydropterin/6-carboxytetrahydropterin synthase